MAVQAREITEIFTHGKYCKVRLKYDRHVEGCSKNKEVRSQMKRHPSFIDCLRVINTVKTEYFSDTCDFITYDFVTMTSFTFHCRGTRAKEVGWTCMETKRQTKTTWYGLNCVWQLSSCNFGVPVVVIVSTDSVRVTYKRYFEQCRRDFNLRDVA